MSTTTMTTTGHNSLLSSIKSSDSSLRASLHPLALLTISDYITRHTLRQQTQPIIGVLLGQQNGREVSVEHAYEVKALEPGDGQTDATWTVHADWFEERLKQYKEVHKDPALDLVGWWTVCPASGPSSELLGIHTYIMHTYNESLVLLGFHPRSVLDKETRGAQLPLTIYESVYENSKDDGKAMQIDGDEGKPAGESLELRFRELAYEIVTGEAEMIGVDFVAKGGGNATVVDTAAKKSSKKEENSVADGDTKTGSSALEDSYVLSPEDEELIASLTTRANAIKMLHLRLKLLQKYLEELPACYLTDASLPTGTVPQKSESASDAQISYPILRSILALTARLPLLIPADNHAFERESQAEKSDVALVSLLGGMGRSIKEAKDLGGKWSVVDSARQMTKKDERRMWVAEEMGLGEHGEGDY